MADLGPSRRVLLSLGVVLIGAVACTGPSTSAGSADTASPSTSLEVTIATPTASVEGDVDEGSTIYRWDPNTGDVRVVLSAPALLANAELSPDGGRVVYERHNSYGPPQIYLLDAGGTERRLTSLPGGASDPTWSPDGRKIAFAASPREGADRDIFLVGDGIFAVDDGSHLRRVGTAANDGDPDWSPDGTRIAFHARYDDTDRDLIWVASVRTRTPTQLTPRGGFQGMDPAWSPDGRWIAYSRFGRGNTLNGRIHAAELWRMRSDGTDTSRITRPDGGHVDENPSWSPDGRLIVFEHHNWDWSRNKVHVINPGTGRVRSILAGAEAVVQMRPSAEGTGVAPSWGQRGILMSLQSGDPAPAPGPAPPAFQVVPGIDAPGIHATITMTRSRCELGGAPDPIRPGRLRLELVNLTHLEAHFTVVRLRRTLTLSQLRALPRSFYAWPPPASSLFPSSAVLWSSSRRIDSGRWAVLCHKDKIPQPNGFFIVPVGVAGPIEVG